MSFSTKSKVRLFALALSGVLTVSACSTTKSSVVDDAMISRLTARERAEISKASSQRDGLIEDLAVAEREAIEAKQDIEIARSGLKIARAQLEQAELLIERSGGGSVSEMTASRVSADWHRARVDASQATLEHARAHGEWARASAKYVASQLERAEAQLELEKVRAVRELNPIGRTDLELERFERAFVSREKASESALARVTRAREKMDRALAERNAAMERAGALTP